MRNLFKNYYFVYYSILNDMQEEIATSSCTVAISKFLKFDLLQIQSQIKRDLIDSDFILKNNITAVTITNITKL